MVETPIEQVAETVTIQLEGFSLVEIRELEALLQSDNSVSEVRRQVRPPEGMVYRSGPLAYLYGPEVKLIVTAAVLGAVSGAAHKAGKKFVDVVAARLEDWYEKRRVGNREATVTLYGPDGKQVNCMKRRK